MITPPLEVHTEQATLTIFRSSMLGIPFSEIHTSHPMENEL